MKRKIVIGIAAAAYLCIGCLFLRAYAGYLKRPVSARWDEVNGVFTNGAVYQSEPIQFDPPWLRHYATDWGRMASVNFRSPRDAPIRWLVTDRPFDGDGYRVLATYRFGTIAVYKLQAESVP